MGQETKKYSYVEPKKALNSRIDAHASYSNFNLHEWIKNNFSFKSGDNILDLGCGTGNYTSVFWDFVKPGGNIIGLDKNKDLIEEAKANHADLPESHIKFWVHDYDNHFPDTGLQFDWIFSVYSLYYTEDSLKLVKAFKEQLKRGGQFVVIGPAPENAKDLADFNYELTGVKPNREYTERIERIEKEFWPLFESIFGKVNVRYEAVDSVMSFPTAESYAQYYYSTLLWRESTVGRSEEEITRLKESVIRRLSKSLPAKINKRMSCLIGEVRQK
mgnify:CR=1 FL=1